MFNTNSRDSVEEFYEIHKVLGIKNNLEQGLYFVKVYLKTKKDFLSKKILASEFKEEYTFIINNLAPLNDIDALGFVTSYFNSDNSFRKEILPEVIDFLKTPNSLLKSLNQSEKHSLCSLWLNTPKGSREEVVLKQWLKQPIGSLYDFLDLCFEKKTAL